MMKLTRRLLIVLSLVTGAGAFVAFSTAQHWSDELAIAAPPETGLPDIGWPHYGNDKGGARYSSAGQITHDNLDRLAPVWTFRTGETGEGYRSGGKHGFQATPILYDGTLFFSTAFNRVFAIDAENGRQRWRFDAGIDPKQGYTEVSNRGVTLWVDDEAAVQDACRTRLFVGTLDARLISLDADNGSRCDTFGKNGETHLMEAIPEKDRGIAYPVTSPPVVLGDTVVLGSGMIDNWKAHLGLGTVWAYDARSGKLRWKWHAIPRNPNADNAADWQPEQADKTGTANVWSPLAVDAELGIIYAATGSASPDYFGGGRLGTNRHANSLVALKASTGAVVWARQLVHHDLWDYDLASQPLLTNINKDGRDIPAVVQATKMGMLFTFDRRTGEPVFEIEERDVPPSEINGENASPTQPFPVAPPPLVPHHAITEQDAWGLTFFDKKACREIIGQTKSQGIYTPPSLEGTIMIPGNAGGSNWGGIAYHPGRQYVLANTMHLPFIVALIPGDDFEQIANSDQYPNAEFSPQIGTPFGMRRKALMSPWGLPCIKPPWGTLAAIDMSDGTIVWQVPFGTTRDVTPFPVGPNIGMPGMGGPIVLENGLIFVGAAMDDYLRAFDINQGRELWRGRLPGGGQATPMTYQLNGRQYIVIAAGGHGNMGTRRSDYLVAFALTE